MQEITDNTTRYAYQCGGGGGGGVGGLVNRFEPPPRHARRPKLLADKTLPCITRKDDDNSQTSVSGKDCLQCN